MIDVIIPAYNCCKTLDRTLGSLVAQTDSDFIVTIVDDCSDENIVTVIERYKDVLDIRYIRNKENVGCGMTRQVGIDNTNCKYFTFLDADDVFMPYTIGLFNSITKENQHVELIHSYIYKHVVNDVSSSMNLLKNGFSYCHGKLYSRELINKFGIKNSPLVKWHDDSYFNSMCAELMNMRIIEIPTMVWCHNPNSVTRKDDTERDNKANIDFLKAMCMSKEFVLKYKDSVDHIDATVKYMTTNCILDEEGQRLLKCLKGE